MKPYAYHPGQREVQREANSVPVADRLSSWVGPVVEFAHGADLIVLGSLVGEALRFTLLSGAPPLVAARDAAEGGIVVRFPPELERRILAGSRCGGIVIRLASAQRSRVGGTLEAGPGFVELRCRTAFTNCRKYMAPSASDGRTLLVGPALEVEVSPDDSRVAGVVAAAETAFLGTTGPDGFADVSHRGGEPGFLEYEPRTRRLRWTEFLGDGMFVSAGNVRSAGRFSLLVLELSTGDAIQLDARGDYTNLRADRSRRVDPLLRAGDAFPTQGRIEGEVTRVALLRSACHPRRRVAKVKRVTSCSPIDEQSPD